jgi:hypothetical protein
VKVTPQSLLADGYQTATITIDCIAADGVSTSNADLSFTRTKYGTLTKYISEEEQEFLDKYNTEKLLNGEESAIEKYGYFITDEHRSGRFIYKYHVHAITTGGRLTEKIIFMDNKTGVGTEVQIQIMSK